jgi:hypothetical protein
MNIKPRTGVRNYAKGGHIVPDSGGLFDPKHPELGAQGESTFYKPAVGESTFYKPDEVPTSRTGSLGSLGEMQIVVDPQRMSWGRK